jgi:integrase
LPVRGHIQQRGKTSWRLKVFVGRDAAGVRRYVERTVRGPRREAERELSRLVVEVDEGRHAAAAPITFGELLDRWLDVKRRLVEPKTSESYEWVARKYVRPALGERKVASLRPIDLDGLYSDLHGRGLSSRTVRICHTVIRQALEQARRWGLIARNPAVDATPPPQRRREIVPPTVQQVQTLLETAEAEDPDFAAYLWVLAATGCRRGEACALRWTDVDLERSEVAIRRSISQVGREVREKDTKTHQSRRVAIDEATVAVLRSLRVRGRERALALGQHLADDALLFSGVEGRPWRPDVCTNRFSRLRAGLGLDKVRLHDLRHFVATVLGGAGVPIATISGRLGHSENATTLNLYTHVMPATDQAAAAYLGSILSEHRRASGTSGPPR